MKKLIFTAAIMIALAACGNNGTDNSNMNQSPPDTSTNSTHDTSSTTDTLNGTVTNPAPPLQ